MLLLLFQVPTYCPMDSPFVLDGGKSCCRFPDKKLNTSLNPLCDGQPLTIDDPAECCGYDMITSCPHQYCQSHPRSSCELICCYDYDDT